MTISLSDQMDFLVALIQTGGPLPVVAPIDGDFIDDHRLLINVDGINQMQLNGFSPRWHITLQTHGDLPTKAFVLSAGSLAVQGIWIEYTMPEEYLAAGIEQFKSEYRV